MTTPCRLFLLLALGVAATAADAEPQRIPTAADLAIRIVAIRADEARAAGRAAMAEVLDDIAREMRRTRMSVADATALLQLVGDAPPTAPLGCNPLRPQPPEAPLPATPRPALTAERAAAVLDGDLAPPPAPGAHAAVDLVTIVLAVHKSDVGRSALVMLDGGADRRVAEGQEFAIRRDGKVLVKVRVDSLKETMSICSIVPGSWTDDQADVREGDEAASLPR